MQKTLTLINRGKLHGAALITALFITALVAAAAIFIALQQTINIRRTQSLINSDQAYLYSQMVAFWAMGLLKENSRLSSKNTVIDNLPSLFPVQKKNFFSISGNITDMQARFNLNNLLDKSAVNQFAKLIQLVNPEVKRELANQIAEATHQWVKPYNPKKTKQILDPDEYYLKQTLPYLPSHAPMVSPSELLLVKGMTAALYLQLLPYITTLPAITPLNINTASAPVLAILGKLSLKEAESIVQERKNTLFTSSEQVMKNRYIIQAEIEEKEITTVSQFFLTTAKVDYDDNSLTVYYLIKREIENSNEKNNSAKLSILWTSQGAW